MTNKWTWAILSAVWFSAAILNYYDQRPAAVILFNLAAAAIFLFLTLCQHLCDKRGSVGTEMMKKILWVALALLLLTALLILLI